MNITQLKQNSDSLQASVNNRLATYNEKLLDYYNFSKTDSLQKDTIALFAEELNGFTQHKKNRLFKASANLIRSSKSYVYNTQRELKYKNKKLKKTHIEWHRKFSLAFACVILFLIGAPLGAIIRKGGMGMPVLVSIIFFLVYHISSITGEKSALQGVITITQGMWLSSFILTPLGILFSYKAANDSSVFDTNKIHLLFAKMSLLWKAKKS
jgi:lipopolysaccharide export system permease protein